MDTLVIKIFSENLNIWVSLCQVFVSISTPDWNVKFVPEYVDVTHLVVHTGTLYNILKFSFWLNFIYHIKLDCYQIYKFKKKNSKIPSTSEKIINFCQACIKWG